MKTSLKVFPPAAAAGLMISIAAVLYLSVENTIIGSLLFTVGLYAVVVHGLYLYTGKVGYLMVQEDKKMYAEILLVTWGGNLAGAVLGGLAITVTRAGKVKEKAVEICEVKLGDDLLSVLILAIFCGILMYVAVDGYKQTKNPIILFLGVSGFILCGFEHCIANMVYYTLAGMWSVKAVGYLLTATLGNGLGAVMLQAMKLKMTE